MKAEMSFTNNNPKTAVTRKTEVIKCEKKQKCILFIPGFLSGKNPQIKAKAELQRLFPGCTVRSMAWEENEASWTDILWRANDATSSDDAFNSFQINWNFLVNSSKDLLNNAFFSPKNIFQTRTSPSKRIVSKWFDAYRNAGAAAVSLSMIIAAMPKKEQENLVLVGHSLGAYIVVKTLESLFLRKMKINQAILLGAAIDSNDPALPAACQATIVPIEYTINYLDWALALYPLVASNTALGQFGYTGMQKVEMKKYILFPGIYHDNDRYIKELIKIREL